MHIPVTVIQQGYYPREPGKHSEFKKKFLKNEEMQGNCKTLKSGGHFKILNVLRRKKATFVTAWRSGTTGSLSGLLEK